MFRIKFIQFCNFIDKLTVRVITLISLVLIIISLSGCEQMMYYGHTVHGHFSLMSNQESITDLINNEKTEEPLKNQLRAVTEALSYAEHRLAMPQAKDSYQNFVHIDKSYPAWSITVTPDDSLTPEQWCYPFTGCMSYRNYYDLTTVEEFASQLSKETLYDSYISGVDAYSTLGWFNDPVLSSFFKRDKTDLFGLLFHELAHQTLYIQGDTTFNESFASAIEETGVELWLRKQPNLMAQYKERKAYAAKFIEILRNTRNQLELTYSSNKSRAEKLNAKEKIIEDLKKTYEEVKVSQWDGYSGFDGWFEKPVNNARLALVNTYTRWVPAFKNWIKACNYDFPKFYQAAKELAEQDQAERHRVLNLYSPYPSSLSALEVKRTLSKASYTKDASSPLCKYSPNN